MRPYWKGYLKLALVSCPIALNAACSTAERIALRQINKATGNRLRQQLIDEETRELLITGNLRTCSCSSQFPDIETAQTRDLVVERLSIRHRRVDHHARHGVLEVR